jgi:hypothetical protein
MKSTTLACTPEILYHELRSDIEEDITSAGNLWLRDVNSALRALTRAGFGTTSRRLEMFSSVNRNRT